MDKFLVQFGPRVKKLSVRVEQPFSFKECLEKAIREAMMGDVFMKKYAGRPFFLTQSDNSGKLDIEIDDSTDQWDVDSNVPIQLMLLDSTNLDIPTVQATIPSAGDTPQITAKDPIPASVESYFSRLGVCAHQDPQPSNTPAPAPEMRTVETNIASTSGHNKTSKDNNRLIQRSQPSSSRQGSQQTTGSSDDEDNDYMEMARNNRAENRNRLEQIVPKAAPKLKPTKKKQAKKRGKENIQPRSMPRRAAKEKTKEKLANDVDGTETDDEVLLAQEEVSDGPLSTNKAVKVVQMIDVGNFHKQKNHRPMGDIITRFTPFPEFPKDLKQSLVNGTYDTPLMNKFLKDFIESVTKRKNCWISKNEYDVIAEKVSNRFKTMNLVKADIYMNKIKKKLSDSLRAARYYGKRKARRAEQAAEAKRRKELASNDKTLGTVSQAEVPVAEIDEADDILQRAVRNKQSVKMCISASTKRIAFIKTHSVHEVLNKYPYLKEADLLIFEYSMRVPLPLDTIQENFSRSILPLSHILDEQLPEEDDELGKIMLYHGIERFFSGDEEHLPSLQFCNAANKNATPLNNIPSGQAPAIVVSNDGSKLLQSATLIFDGDMLTTICNPSAFDCVALMLSAYWVFHINFPRPYLQHMESIEAILHGQVTEKARKVLRLSKMEQFLRKFIISSECDTA